MLRRKSALENREGLGTSILDGDEARALAPYLSPAVRGACWCPTEGHANPRLVAPAFAAAAARLGATIRAAHSGGRAVASVRRVARRDRGRRTAVADAARRRRRRLDRRGHRARGRAAPARPPPADDLRDGADDPPRRTPRPARRAAALAQADGGGQRARRRRLARATRRSAPAPRQPSQRPRSGSTRWPGSAAIAHPRRTDRRRAAGDPHLDRRRRRHRRQRADPRGAARTSPGSSSRPRGPGFTLGPTSRIWLADLDPRRGDRVPARDLRPVALPRTCHPS